MPEKLHVGGEEWTDFALWLSLGGEATPTDIARAIGAALREAPGLPKRVDLALKRFGSAWWCVRLQSIDRPDWRLPEFAMRGAWAVSIRMPQKAWRVVELTDPPRLVGELPEGSLVHPDPRVEADVLGRLSELVGRSLARVAAYFDWMERWGGGEEWQQFTIVFDGTILELPRSPAEFGFFSDRATQRAAERESRIRFVLAGACVVATALLVPAYVYFHTLRPPAEEPETIAAIVALLAFWGLLASLVTWEFRPTLWVKRLGIFEAANLIAFGLGWLLARLFG